jgi:hypothetical protein
LRENIATKFFDSIDSKTTRDLIRIPYDEVLFRFAGQTRLPVADFDLAFFVEGLYVSMSCHNRIIRYLDGFDERWFPEDDDEIRGALFCPLPEPSTSRQPALIHAFSLDLLVRRHKARWFLHSFADVATIQIIGVALAAFDRHVRGRPIGEEPRLPPGCPLAPFDLLFCTEVLLPLAAGKQRLRSIILTERP